ncbi:MAG: endolytic transglycosylase MltG [Polyangiaceae bacterium]
MSRGARSGKGRRKSSRPPPAATPPAPARRSQRGSRSTLLGLLAALGTSIIAATATILVWATLEDDTLGERVVLEFRGDESANEVAEQLAGQGLLTHPGLFAIYMGWFTPRLQVAPGNHVLRSGLSARHLLQRLGRLASRSSVRVALPEGYTLFQVAERLQEKEICEAVAFVRASNDAATLSSVGITGTSAEGYLFPATYELLVDSEPAHVLKQLVAELRKRLARVDARAGGALSRIRTRRGWGEREVLTLASMVEREAAVSEERPLIASVFFNRLDDPSFRPLAMLQSDPTAAYGCLVAGAQAASCANFTGKVSAEMLRDSGNPYNTYRHAGLPPGPIANPGEDAILAVLNPAQGSYLYFVADGRGRHRFSRNFEEHRRAIEQGALPLGNEQR